MLREGDDLGSDARFYLIASGTVTCHKTFEVQDCPGMPTITNMHDANVLLARSSLGTGM